MKSPVPEVEIRSTENGRRPSISPNPQRRRTLEDINISKGWFADLVLQPLTQ